MVFNYSFAMMCLFIYVAGWAVAIYSRWTQTGKVKAISLKSRLLTVIGGLVCAVMGIRMYNMAVPLIPLPPPLIITVPGCLLLSGGISLSLWGCFQYHKVFFVSVWTKGGELYPSLPYTLMRQPIYAGLIIALPGFFCLLPMLHILIPCLFLTVILVLKAWADDDFLSDRLGRNYKSYSKNVPLFFPFQLSKKN